MPQYNWYVVSWGNLDACGFIGLRAQGVFHIFFARDQARQLLDQLSPPSDVREQQERDLERLPETSPKKAVAITGLAGSFLLDNAALLTKFTAIQVQESYATLMQSLRTNAPANYVASVSGGDPALENHEMLLLCLDGELPRLHVVYDQRALRVLGRHYAERFIGDKEAFTAACSLAKLPATSSKEPIDIHNIGIGAILFILMIRDAARNLK